MVPRPMSAVRELIAACVSVIELWTVMNAQPKLIYKKLPNDSRIFFHCNVRVSDRVKNLCEWCEDHTRARRPDRDFDWKIHVQYNEVVNFFEGSLEFAEWELPGLLLRYEFKLGQKICYGTLTNCWYSSQSEVPYECIFSYAEMHRLQSAQVNYPQNVPYEPRVQHIDGKGSGMEKGHPSGKGVGPENKHLDGKGVESEKGHPGGKSSGSGKGAGSEKGHPGGKSSGSGKNVGTEKGHHGGKSSGSGKEHLSDTSHNFGKGHGFGKGHAANEYSSDYNGSAYNSYNSSSNTAVPYVDRNSSRSITLTMEEYENLRNSPNKPSWFEHCGNSSIRITLTMEEYENLRNARNKPSWSNRGSNRSSNHGANSHSGSSRDGESTDQGDVLYAEPEHFAIAKAKTISRTRKEHGVDSGSTVFDAYSITRSICDFVEFDDDTDDEAGVRDVVDLINSRYAVMMSEVRDGEDSEKDAPVA